MKTPKPGGYESQWPEILSNAKKDEAIMADLEKEITAQSLEMAREPVQSGLKHLAAAAMQPTLSEEVGAKAFREQVGGSHYTGMAIQPMEYFMANRMLYPEASVVGYVSRWREKGGVEDLRKARHMLDMIIEAYERGKYH